jgi:hypothetical protein
MAIIYTYPNLPLSNLSADDLLVITNVDATNNNPTRSVTLADIATYVTGTGSGTGTTNKIVKFTDGANGLLGDSIMTEDVDKIYVDGQLRIGSSSGASRIQIFHDVLNSDTTFSSGGATGSQIIGRRNELYIENCGASRGDIIFKANNGENNGSTETYFLLDASMADIGTSAKYTRWPDQSRIVLGNSSNVNSLNFEMYYDNGTSFYNDQSTFGMYSKGGFIIENESGGSGNIEIIQSVVDADIEIKGSNGNYFKADTSAGATIFSLPVEVPLIPAADANAASKQYVDQQISSVVSGLVFQSTWDARTQAQGGLAGDAGNPDLSGASKKVVGHYYVVSVAGSATPNGAGTLPNSWNVGDWCIYVEQGATDRWEKLDQTFVSGLGVSGQVTYWNSQNEVAGDNNFFWDNANKRLGVGTNTPDYRVHIKDNSVTTGSKTLLQLQSDPINNGGSMNLDFRVSSANTVDRYVARISGMREGNGAKSQLQFWTENSGLYQRMSIDSAGDILISPRDTAASSGSGILYFKNVDDNSATINGASIRTVDSSSNPSGVDMRFQVANDSGTLFDAVTIDSNGFMGIGTTAPDQQLEVSGNIRLSNGAQRNIIGPTNENLGIFANPNDATEGILFSTDAGSTTEMIILNGGNVGIGTTSPSYKLHTKGTVNGNVNIAVENDSTGVDAYSSYRFKNDSIDTAVMFLTGSNNTNYAGASSLNMYQGTNLPLGFVTNNTLRMIVTGDGKVGIGVETPISKVHVKDDFNNSSQLNLEGNTPDHATIRVENDNTTTGSYSSLFLRADTGDSRIAAVKKSNANNDVDIVFMLDDTSTSSMVERLRIVGDTGNVGIGTTSPTAKLQIAADFSSSPQPLIFLSNSGANNPGGGSEIIFSSSTSSTTSLYNAKIQAIRSSLDNGSSDLFFQTTHVATSTSPSTKMTIKSDGNVGIGTTSPGALLHLSSTSPSIYLEDTDATNTYNITRISNAGGILSFDTRRSSDGAFVSTDYQIVKDAAGADYHRWFTQGTEKMRVNSSGDILFGTTSETNSHAYFSAESNSRMVLSLGADTTSASTIASFKNSNGAVGSISVSGSATAFNTSSDYRLKKDLKDFDGLDKVSKIPVYDFKWKVDDSSSYGVMAHELQEVLPDAVSGEKDGEEMQGVDYSKIVPLLIKSIQELEAKVKTLENK